jgi:hypothetical protein
MSIQSFGAMNVGPSRSVGTTRDGTHGRVAAIQDIKVQTNKHGQREGAREGGRRQ